MFGVFQFAFEALDQVAALHEQDHSVLVSDISSTVVSVFNFLVVLTFMHLVLHVTLKLCNVGNANRTHLQNSYKATSFIMNAYLAWLGIYHFYFTLPATTTVITDRIVGFEELNFLAVAVIAYNLWALPVGFLVKEPKVMLMHHMAVLVIASLPAFFTFGFRYYTPFFFGLIESSSVPLVLMNLFRENPDLDKRYPTLSLITSLSFACSFLTTRVVMWLPQVADFLHLAFLLAYTSDSIAKAMLGTCMCVCIFLTGLQLFWALKIIDGIVDAVRPKK